MCGIYGILSLTGPLTRSRDVLDRMGSLTRHRGPDDAGTLVEPELALGMRRLSIIDVVGGHQPIYNEDRSIAVVCNGEIYNFVELRRQLEAAGHRFTTRSDTEVIVHLYEEYGNEFVRRLEGMFAFALWDAGRRRLLIARDALGVKPLYYRLTSNEIIFASEAKAILAVPGVEAKLDTEALVQYLTVGYVCAPSSMFAGIAKLPPGRMLVLERGRCETMRFWQIRPEVDRSLSEAEWAQMLRVEMNRAVCDQMVSDVPLGAFLSGGLDSSAVVAFMSAHASQPIKTYSIGFSGSSGAELYNELPHARRVAEAFGTDHREIVVQPDVASLLPMLVWHLDEPVCDSAFITTYLVSKFAREDVTVILSGVGGDELFGGYTRYLDEHYRASYRRVPSWLRRRVIDPVARRLPSDRNSRLLNRIRLAKAFILADSLDFEERYRSYMEVFGAADRAALGFGEQRCADDCIRRAFADTQATDPLRRLMDVDLATQLADDLLMLTDRMSMAVSLECRVPLLDQRLVALAARMPEHVKVGGGRLKRIMKTALRGVLPDSILEREKRGFGAPMGAWFRSELAPLVGRLLAPDVVRRRGLLDPEAVQAVIGDHQAQRRDGTDQLLALVNLEIWCRLYLDGENAAGIVDELRTTLVA